ncbi:MAG: hypothetical protein ACFFED_00935 [Candidatus Thorarchaeota archaeon]
MKPNPDLYQQCKDLLSKPIASESSDNPEVITSLWQSDWVRILLVRNIDNPDWTTIEIESSLPLRVQGEHKNIAGGLETRELLNGMIQTLEYLLRLQDAGFSLDIIGQDCMWTAFLEFDALPAQSFFEALIP